MIRHAAQLLFVLAAALAVACLPAAAGKVVCRTDGGHFAIEPAHEAGCCPDAHADEPVGVREPHDAGDHPAEPCRDVPLASQQLAAPARESSPAKAAPSSPVPPIGWDAAMLPATGVEVPSLALVDRTGPPARPPDQLVHIRTVILLT